MMPHPERAAEPIINPKNSKPASMIFDSLLNNLGVAQ
jgi:phosphoribosylformylglycinamidine synthase